MLSYLSARVDIRRLLETAGAIGGFFMLKLAVGLALVVQSAHRLTVAGFGEFSQLFLFLALLSAISAGGVQMGLIRQVSAAGGDVEKERRSTAAAVLIWGAVGTVILGISFLFRDMLSTFLVGSHSASGTIPALAGAALAAGGGQLLCAVLTGRSRAPTSMTIQGVGLAVGGIFCWVRLDAGDASGAVLGYAAGPILTSLIGIPLTWKWLPRRVRLNRATVAEVQLLLHFSGALLVTMMLMPTTLFCLRYFYRSEFGAEALGYWLAANRVSDVTSQLLGLYMSQLYLPAVARATGPIARSALVRRTFLCGTAIMGSGLIAFLTVGSSLVRIFLSPQFLPAIPFIIGYLVGDVLRVSISLNLYTALAHRRLGAYVGIEVATSLLLMIYVTMLTTAHIPSGAYLGYVGAQATVAVLLWLVGKRLVRPPEPYKSLSG